MLHDAGDDHLLAVAQDASQSHSMASRRYWSISTGLSPETCDGGGDVVIQLLLGIDDFHGPAAQHIAGAHQHRIADARGDRPRLVAAARDAVGIGCLSFSLSTSAAKRSRSSARSMASGEVPRIGMPASSSACASLSGVCPPNCTITPFNVRRSTARHAGFPAHPRRSAARNRAGLKCRNRSKPSPDCS
jgi:hypothetical protein